MTFNYGTLQAEALRRDNKMLTQELKDLTDQLSEGGKNVHDLQKGKRRLEMEKDELQVKYDSLLESSRKILCKQLADSLYRLENRIGWPSLTLGSAGK